MRSVFCIIYQFLYLEPFLRISVELDFSIIQNRGYLDQYESESKFQTTYSRGVQQQISSKSGW